MKTIHSALALAGVCSVMSTQAGILTNPTITLSAPPFGAAFAPTNVFDSKQDDYASQSRGFGASLSTTEGTFLEFDFGQAVTMDRFIDVTRRNTADVVNTERLIFSNDPVFDVSDPFVDFNPAGSNGNGFIKSFAPRTARYVRWEVVDGALNGALNTRNFGSVEMRFLSPSTGLVQLTPTVIGGAQPFNETSFALVNAVNGDAGRAGGPGIEYASLGQGPNMFVDFDMGSVRPIAGFDFYDRFGVTAGVLVDRVNTFDLLFSNDSTFTTGVTTLSFTPGEWGYNQQFAPVNARYVRFDATSTANPTSNSGIQEITFYAVPEPTTGLMLLCGAAIFARGRRSA